jgi:hypothetical protein
MESLWMMRWFGEAPQDVEVGVIFLVGFEVRYEDDAVAGAIAT